MYVKAVTCFLNDQLNKNEYQYKITLGTNLEVFDNLFNVLMHMHLNFKYL